MNVTMLVSSLALLGTGTALPAKPIHYVGQVIIVGNEVTKDEVIRRHLTAIQPGTILRYSELKDAEKKLAALGLFAHDPPPSIIVDPTGDYKNIIVKVTEKKTRRWMVKPGVNWLGRAVLRVILQDGNFDPAGIPSSLAEIKEGRAFRGGGQKVRIEVVRFDILQARVELLPVAPVSAVMILLGWNSE